MTLEPMERDTALAGELARVAGEPMGADAPEDAARWADLRRATNARAAAELARRRTSRRMRFVLPLSAAAGFALFVLVARLPEPTGVETLPPGRVGTVATIDELLDADVSDGQFRALIAGAADADELLLIAAEDER